MRVRCASFSAAGTSLVLTGPGGAHRLDSPLLGERNAENLAAAWAALEALGLAGADAAEALAATGPPPGRMELVAPPVGARRPLPRVVVDFAHTPDALAGAIAACRRLAGDGRLTVVFGAGGDRDPAKRPLMGEIAARGADRVLLTSDNPRSEDPEAILADIREGCRGAADARAEVESDPDRRAAIRRAIADADPNGLVLVAGRGPETAQVVGAARIPLSDAEAATEALDALAGGVLARAGGARPPRRRRPGFGSPGKAGSAPGGVSTLLADATRDVRTGGIS